MSKPTMHSTPSKFIVCERAAKMPSSCAYAYMYCAVVETDGRESVAMISDRARGVRSIRRIWAPYPKSGATARSGRQQALEAASALASRLQVRADARRADEARDAHRVEGA